MSAHHSVGVILRIWPELGRLAGEDWPTLKLQLLDLLRDFESAADEEQRAAIVIKTLRVLRGLPGFGPLFKQAQGSVGATRNPGDPHEGLAKGIDEGTDTSLSQAEVRAQVLELLDLENQGKYSVNVGSGSGIVIGDNNQVDFSVPKQPFQQLRYLNAGFFPATNDQPLPVDQPLALDGGPYRLGVNVGRFWGPGKAGSAIPDNLLAPDFVEREVLELDVRVSSRSFKIPAPQAKLSLSRSGDSALVFFDLSVERTGRQVLDVDLIFRGNLLQSRRVEVEVVAHSADTVPESAWPVQDGYITFTRTAALAPEQLADITRRQVLIVAQRDVAFNRIGLRFYDNASGTDLGFYDTDLNDLNLTSALTAVRAQLLQTMDAYTGFVGSTREVLEKHMGLLAEAGNNFFWALLPALAERSRARLSHGGALPAGTVIQVAPLSTQLSVPWEAIYERPIEAYRPGEIRLCQSFLEHGPEATACPGYGDPTIVCPHGFWGYRYIIEQVPCRIIPHVSPPSASLPLYIRNGLPLRLTAHVSTELGQQGAHIEALHTLAPATHMRVISTGSRADLRAALVNAGEAADIIYFYAHGGADRGVPYLKVGADEMIKLTDLRAWQVAFDHQPLVVLNACESAAYSPDSFENMIWFFTGAGAAGVIAAQCATREHLATTFMLAFFRTFLGQMPAGQALFQARHELLRRSDPRGLAYSLFASADVQLLQPAIT